MADQAINQSTPISNTTEQDVDTRDLLSNFGILQHNMDVFFLIIIGMLIFFMQGGFALLEAGAVRSKNTTNILIKNILDVFIGGFAYWIVGFPLAYGEGNHFIGYSGWMSIGLEPEHLAFWFFQFVFAATTATIVSGALAERCGFGAYLVYSAVLTGFVYPVVSHWCWTDIGWLANHNFQDFAGSGVVHLTAGIAALVGCVILGPRLGRFGPNSRPISGHSVPLTALGGFILLFGFLAFNGGSQGSISQEGDAAGIAVAVVNTVIAGCSAGIIVLLMHRFTSPCVNPEHHWSFLLTLNGALTGMVALCAGCNDMPIWGGVVTGGVAGIIYYIIHHLMIKMHVDDPLDAVAVHGGGGIWGLIAVALFRHDGIVFQGENAMETLKWNGIGMLAIIGWTSVLCIIMFSLLRYMGLLRVSTEVELRGLDIMKHGESAYPADAWQEEQYVQGTKDAWQEHKQCVLQEDITASHPCTSHIVILMYWTLPDPRRCKNHKMIQRVELRFMSFSTLDL
ncbi:unnamed protein product, partial [Meganyctiphanes norvegica]